MSQPLSRDKRVGQEFGTHSMEFLRNETQKHQRGRTVGHSECILYCAKGLWCTSCGTNLFLGVRPCLKGYCFAVYTNFLPSAVSQELQCAVQQGRMTCSFCVQYVGQQGLYSILGPCPSRGALVNGVKHCQRSAKPRNFHKAA